MLCQCRLMCSTDWTEIMIISIFFDMILCGIVYIVFLEIYPTKLRTQENENIVDGPNTQGRFSMQAQVIDQIAGSS